MSGLTSSQAGAMVRSLPGNLYFRDALLVVLGTRSGFLPEVLVPLNLELQVAIIQEGGFDTNNLSQYGTPEEGWRLEGDRFPPGLLRRTVLCYQGSYRHRAEALTIHGPRGQWGLTAAGVAEAQRLIRSDKATLNRVCNTLSLQSFRGYKEVVEALPMRRKRETGENATAAFLNKRIRETGGYNGTFMRALRQAVVRKLPVSQASGQIEDHLQNCFARLIARDSLAARLSEGYTITDQQMALFAVRAAYTDARDSGGNPVCRELYGARTDSERTKGIVLPAISDPRVVWSSEDSGEPSHWEDIADNSSNPEEAMAFAGIMEQVAAIIRKKKPSVADRYINLVAMRAQGLSLKEIAEEENVTPCRAAALMAEVRRVLRLGGLDVSLGLQAA